MSPDLKSAGSIHESLPGSLVSPESADVFADAGGLVSCADYDAGLYIMEDGG